jgi:ribosome recycling factor
MWEVEKIRTSEDQKIRSSEVRKQIGEDETRSQEAEVKS